jgi:thiosulfate/3-mercaptopyruvate sulfurtransferase
MNVNYENSTLSYRIYGAAGMKSALFALILALVALPQARAAEPLVTAGWLNDKLDRENLTILDVRNAIDGGSAQAFAEGHIPGAVYSNYLKDGWRVRRDGVPGQLPPVAELEDLIGGLGIDNDDHVIVVAGGTSALDMGSATRVYWTFKVLGHDEVSVLDGGHKAYAAAYPLESGTHAPRAATFEATFQPDLMAAREDVAQAMTSGAGTTLVDNRPEPQYAGESKHPAAAKAGTIPGARNVPESRLTVDGGRFVDAEQVAALLDGAGVARGGEAISFCNTGHWASLGWFAMHEILGRKDTKLYDGSMTEWTTTGGEVVNHTAASE